MIFDQQAAKQILAGKKTTHRRLIRGDELRPGNLQPGGAVPLERPAIGEEIRDDLRKAVLDGRARRPSVEVGQLLIDSVGRQRLGDVTLLDARTEGFKTTIAFKAAWVRRRDRRWIAEMEEMGDEHGDPALSDEDLAERFDLEHAACDVWVISFTVDRDAPTFLAARSEIGYVHQKRGAWTEEPEAVRPDVVSELTTRARRNEGQGVAADWLKRREQIEQDIASLMDGHALTASDAKFLRRLRHMLDLGDRRFAA